MAVTASLCETFLFVGVFMFVSAEQKIITADPGQDVTLTCRAPNNNKIIVLKWSRADLETGNVLLYRMGKFAPANQHPSFKNRVDLQDRQMKDGDVSVILKDVTTDDEGTYTCLVFMEGAHSWDLISIIYLSVDPPGPTQGTTDHEGKEHEGKKDEGKQDGGKENGSFGLKFWLSVVAVILFVEVAIVVFWFGRSKQWGSKSSNDDEGELLQTLDSDKRKRKEK